MALDPGDAVRPGGLGSRGALAHTLPSAAGCRPRAASPQPLPRLPSASWGVTGAARGLTYSGRSERLTRGWGAGQGEAGEAEAHC